MGNYITEKELCEKLKWSRGFLYKLRKAGMPHIKAGSDDKGSKARIRYDEEEVKEWLKERSKNNN